MEGEAPSCVALAVAMSRSSGATRNQRMSPVATQKQFSVSVKDVTDVASRRISFFSACLPLPWRPPARPCDWLCLSKYSRYESSSLDGATSGAERPHTVHRLSVSS